MKQKIVEFKEDFYFWIDFLSDKRYSIRFKICNIIMGDLLREYLACIQVNASEIIRNEDIYKGIPEAQAKLAVIRAKHIWRDLDNIMR